MTLADFERRFSQELFGPGGEPSWDQIRDGARRNLMGAEGVDPAAARRIWETNEALPQHLRQTSPQLMKEFGMDDAQLENRTAALPGPRVTKADVTAAIAKVDYHVFTGTTQTVCCMTLTNGFTVLGSSACADPANFDEQLGRDLAYDDALDEVWNLLGFQLRERLYQARLRAAESAVGAASPVPGTAEVPPRPEISSG